MRSIARAFAQNPVFANIVLLLIFLGGYAAARGMTRETFPDLTAAQIQVTVLYPGANPAEVEEGISRKLEEALEGLAGIRQLTTDAQEGLCRATILVDEAYDIRQVLDQVRIRVDSIVTFPADAEKPIIADRIRMDLVLLLALSADVSERRLKRWAEDLKVEILDLDEVSQVTVAGARDFEIAVEVAEETLQAHGLTLAELAAVIRASSLNVPAGTVRTGGEDVGLRTVGRRYTAEELGDIVVRALPNGDRITLRQIAEIRDGFVEDRFVATLDGSPAVFLLVSKTPTEDSITISDALRTFVAEKQAGLPPGARIELMYDMSTYLRARIHLLLKNGIAGLVLVFLLVWAFLDFRLSFWVGLGMPVSIAGGLVVMWALGQSINMVSLFALIMVLGLVVDDAIVVGEAIYQKRADGLEPLEAAMEGLAEVGWPVLAGVTTTIAAFVPLAYISGVMGKFIGILPAVVIGCLVASLVEVVLLFPAHLGHGGDPARAGPRPVPFLRRVHRARTGIQHGLAWFIAHAYAPSLDRALRWRYPAMAAAIAAFLLVVGIVTGGWIRFELFGNVDGSILTATVELPSGTPLHVTQAAVQRIEEGMRELADRLETRTGEPLVRHVLALAGASLDISERVGPHVGSVQAVLLDSNRRGIHSDRIMVEWEQAIGPIAGAESLRFEINERGPGLHSVEIRLRGRDLEDLLASSEVLLERLRQFEGVYQAERSFRLGKKEIRFELKPEARAMGLTVADLASQLRARYFGQEAIRIPRDREEVRVNVRYPPEERARLSTLEGVRIRMPTGAEAPLFSVAAVSEAPGYASIRRIDGMRAVTVTGEVDADIANTGEILRQLRQESLEELRSAYPGVRISFEGENRALEETIDDLQVGFPIAVVAMYVLIAAVFRSYFQPVVILFTIPLGIFGAVVAHLLLGLDLTMLSLFGMVALAGVAVNDAVVMIDAANVNLAAGMPFAPAVRDAGTRRFRAVMLTTLTTVGGLAPLILETDLQAQFLIPMAVSIAGGELLGTMLTVLLIPILLYILNDIRRLGFRLLRGRWPDREEVEPAFRRGASKEGAPPEASAFPPAPHPEGEPVR